MPDIGALNRRYFCGVSYGNSKPVAFCAKTPGFGNALRVFNVVNII